MIEQAQAEANALFYLGLIIGVAFAFGVALATYLTTRRG